MSKPLKIFFPAIVLLLAATAFSCVRVKGLKPEALGMNYTLENSDTRSEVRIIRDENYLPHVIAQTEEDMFYGLGFVMAQDRFSQMDVLRRASEGRLSEILGSTPSYHGLNLARLDALVRTFRYLENAREGYESMSPRSKRLLEAFTAGINRYMDEIGNDLPFEAETLKIKPAKWRPEDSLAIWGLFGLSMCIDNLFSEYYLDRVAAELGAEKAKYFLPRYPTDAPIITAGKRSEKFLKPFLALSQMFESWIPHPQGSNNWVVAPARSATGGPILANDPHVPLVGIPTFWYHCHIKCDSYEMMGMAFPGSPFFGAGTNGKIAWGLTNVMADHIDLFREKINPDNPDQYLYKGRWENFKIVNVVVQIKGKKRPKKFSYRMSRHGSIIEGDLVGDYKVRKWAGGEVMAVKTVEADMGAFAEGYIELPKSENWDQFRKACSKISAGPIGWNHVYADIEGNIGYQTTANIPLRADNDGQFISEGWTGEGDWIGRVPFDELPKLYNPPRGYLLSANNRVEGDNYPYYISSNYLPYRAMRINEFLSQRKRMGVEDMMELQADTVDINAREHIDAVINDLKGAGTLRLAVARDILKRWKERGCRDEMEERGPVIFWAMFKFLPFEVIGDETGKKLGKTLTGGYPMLSYNLLENIYSDPNNKWFDDVNTPERETRRDITVRAMKKGLKWAEKALGDDMSEWKWGNLHKITLGHPMAIMPSPYLWGRNKLTRGPYPHPGGNETVNNAAYISWRNKGFRVILGPSSRLIVDMTDPRAAYMSASAGMSSNPVMPHYDNLTPVWRNNDYVKMYMDEEKFIENNRGIMLLKPERN